MTKILTNNGSPSTLLAKKDQNFEFYEDRCHLRCLGSNKLHHTTPFLLPIGVLLNNKLLLI